MARLNGDKGYDDDSFRRELRNQDAIPVNPERSNRKRPIRYDKRRYLDRWRIEYLFCRLIDFRCVATRYAKLAQNFFAAVAVAAIVAHWIPRRAQRILRTPRVPGMTSPISGL